MAGVTEFVILGRGGQGGVTAARILVSAALKDGKWGQAIPEFGAERRGAVVKSYARIADKPVPLHSNVKKADVLIVLISNVLDLVNIDELMKSRDSIIIVNSPSPIKTGYRTYYVDATSISEKLGLIIAGWHIVSTPLLGAVARVTGVVSLESIINSLPEFVGRENLVKLNAEAVKLGYESVRGGEK
ncbi:2-oxoacid:acceptor oxidoreductase family protein [Vulcanisaeta souniana]|uniref:pyruvate synthase n=1 Tax=Vulcanisaeta souniana JCM 11219 TaxID=1293586 RepID=A0A830EC95_9CREN|nr:2-oxoacid:acceptor oxidoreductase family protein [Vulcanisaeta souniana]BDR91237.1 pyruvate synthase [Vulcanisaeta souniana JCM 11219]GGI85188.1 pyruvate synthase [Vulcanisaeta souniana JCM 11219]